MNLPLAAGGLEWADSVTGKPNMNKNAPLISVIIPVYNGQDYLENCIKSIQNQTYGNLELIIVNDGSTDATGQLCERLREAYDNVRILTLGDEGVSAARNTGIEASKGELITFVDADDRLHPEMLQKLYDCMESTGSDVAGCRFFLWGSEAEWEQKLMAAEPGGQLRTYEADDYLREALLCGNSRCWSKLYRRKLVEQVRFQEKLSIGEDMLFLLRLLPLVRRITETDYPGYGYFQNPEGAIKRAFTPSYMDQITCWQLAREEVLGMDPGLDVQVCVHYVMAVMLTAGKLAMLPGAVRREYQAYISVCHERLREVLRTEGVYGRLSAGYRVKAGLFLLWPKLYLALYHLHKE